VAEPAPAARPPYRAQPAPVTGPASVGRPSPATKPQRTHPAGLRLTRRGRVVLAALTMLAAAAAVTLIWMAAAGSAAASSSGTPAKSPYAGMTQVVVRPGQTIWSVAVAADPSANAWTVVQQIMDVNSLTGTNIQAGQLLWVPQN
jgi:hypothetical protein